MSDNWQRLPNFHGKKYTLLRIPIGKSVPANHLRYKKFMDKTQVKELFDGEVVIEEKLDGRQMAKVFPYADQMSAQVDSRIASMKPNSLIVYGEYLKITHSINYSRLPSWFILWEVFDLNSQTFLDYGFRKWFCQVLGFPMPPMLFVGRTTLQDALKLLDRKSTFGDETQEGIVIKNYKKQLFGKIVRQEFVAGIELKGHYLRNQPRMNRLAVSEKSVINNA